MYRKSTMFAMARHLDGSLGFELCPQILHYLEDDKGLEPLRIPDLRRTLIDLLRVELALLERYAKNDRASTFDIERCDETASIMLKQRKKNAEVYEYWRRLLVDDNYAFRIVQATPRVV
jgi:hypothetical protein